MAHLEGQEGLLGSPGGPGRLGWPTWRTGMDLDAYPEGRWRLVGLIGGPL